MINHSALLQRAAPAIAAVLALSLVLGACSMAVRGPEGGRDVDMLALPDGGGTVPMPPAWMRRQIEMRMANGSAPGFVEISAQKLKRACDTGDDLLGCVVDLKGLKVTYVRAGLSPEVRHMVLVHEYAHDLFDWEH